MNTLIVEAATQGHDLPSPLMAHLTSQGLQSCPKTKRVQLVVKNEKGRIVPIGHDNFPLDYLRAASPQVNKVLRKSGKKIGMFTIVQLPGHDARAYHNIFNAVEDTFITGQLKLCVTVANDKQPLTAYRRMYVAAADLGMQTYEDSLICRTMAMLFGDLSRKQLSISAFDVKSCLMLVNSKDEFYQSLAGAIGRALATDRLSKSAAFKHLMDCDAEFKSAVQQAEKEWREIGEGGKEILNRIW